MKKAIVVLIIILILVTLTACGNQTILDTQYTFEKAKIEFGGEVIEINVKQWNDYEDGSVQIIATDGRIYLTDYINVLLMHEVK